MANDNFPRGLVPVNLAPFRVHFYAMDTSNDIWLNAPVIFQSNGFVTLGGTGQMVDYLGVAVGFLNGRSGSPSELTPYFKAANATNNDWWVSVTDDPHQEYFIQESTNGTALTNASVGEGYDMAWTAAAVSSANGNTTTGYANLTLDRATTKTTTNAALQLLRLHPIINTDGTQNAAGNFCKWVVKFLRHAKAEATVNPLV